jgi:hypothetical protein
MSDPINEKVKFNGKEMTVEEFEQEKRRLTEQTGVKVIEVSKDEFKTRLVD